jgi:hypothetical protein
MKHGGVHDNEVAVRSLVADDLDWVVQLAARRAEQRQSFAPRFWRQAADAQRVHGQYLSSLIEAPGVAALRTDHMFAFGIYRPELVLVDDAAADCEDRWAIEGPALFRRLAGASHVRLVCPVPEPGRTALAVELGLRCAETWWHRDLSEPPAHSRDEGPLQVRGAQGSLVAAPPVYAPGGLVLLVTEFHDGLALAQMERKAARRGASVSVVTQLPEDDTRAKMLLTLGYRRTCDFYEGALEVVHRDH